MSSGWEPAVAGAISGTATAILLQPLDVIKTRQQQPNPLYFRSSLVFKHIYRTEGWKGFFRGSVPSLLRVAPGAGFYFWALQSSQENYPSVACYSYGFLDPKAESPPMVYNAVSSGLCRLVAAVAFAPILFVKTRVESSIEALGAKTRGRMFRVIGYTFKHEGWRGFFTGLGPALMRDLPFASVYYALYVTLLGIAGFENPLRVREKEPQRQHAKLASVIPFDEVEEEEEDDMKQGAIGMAALEDAMEKDEQIGLLKNFFVASIAGVFASILTHPFDVIRTQMQLWNYRPTGDALAVVPQTQKIGEIGSIERIVRLPDAGSGSKAVIEATAAVPTIATDPKRLNVYVSQAPAPPTRVIPRGAQHTMSSFSLKGGERIGIFRFSYHLLKMEGFDVFWRGLAPRIARRTLATALAWTAFEELNQKFVLGFSQYATSSPSDIQR